MRSRFVKIFQTVFASTILFAVISCGKTEIPEPAKQCRRTVLVYQVANNNLGSAGYNEMDINEMRKAADLGKIPADGRLLVYNAAPNITPFLLEIKNNKVDTLKIYTTDILSITSERMLEVFDDAAKFAPSDEFGLILWSHGSGWLQDGISDNADSDFSPLSFGSEKGRTMNISTLANVLRNGPELSFLYFDCCYMASVETLYELRDIAPIIIGSATELPVYGMPYDENIEHFFGTELSLVSAAKNTFKLYNSLQGSSRTCTMSVVDTRYLEELAQSCAAIFSKASAKLPSGYKPQRFMSRYVSTCYYFDMEDYIRALCLNDNGSERFDNAQKLWETYHSSLNKCVIYKDSTPRIWDEVDINHHCGISTYIIDEESKLINKRYNTLQWYNDVVSKLNF